MRREWGEVVEVKTNFVQMLAKQLAKRPKGTFGIGTVTDPYQPLEREHEITRACIKELKHTGSPISVLTKSDLVLRDIDLMAGWKDAEVGVSIASVDDGIAMLLEPGAPGPEKRLEALKRLSDEGIATYAMAAPILPGLSDSERSLENLVRKIAGTGARRIMWDKYNPKPLAGSRLKKVFAARNIDPPKPDGSWASSVSRILAEECTALEIELLDAF